MARAAQSWLVCVELRAERSAPGAALYAPRALDILPRLRLLLRHARGNDWVVAHVQARRQPGLCGPIDGLEPLADEPVYLLEKRSAFSAPAFAARAANEAGVLYFAGFAVSDLIAPSLIAARSRAVRTIVVEDAIAHSRGEPISAAQTVGLLKAGPAPIQTTTTAAILAGRASAAVVNICDFVRGREFP